MSKARGTMNERRASNEGLSLLGGARLRNLCGVFTLCTIVLLSTGCEAFVRKFTRKSQRKPMDEAALVLEPERYDHLRLSPEDLAAQYYSFWRGWHEELVQVLIESTNHRKHVYRAQEALENLVNLSALLNEDAQASLQPHIEALAALRDTIAKDIHGLHAARLAAEAESLKQKVINTLPSKSLAEQVAGAKEP